MNNTTEQIEKQCECDNGIIYIGHEEGETYCDCIEGRIRSLDSFLDFSPLAVTLEERIEDANHQMVLAKARETELWNAMQATPEAKLWWACKDVVRSVEGLLNDLKAAARVAR